MNPLDVPMILQYLLGGTGIAGVVMAVRAWIRGRKDDESLEADLQDKITAMADKWLVRAEERLERAEHRAEKAEAEMAQLRSEFNTYKFEKDLEARRMTEQLQTVYIWIESGAHPPNPTWPEWLARPFTKEKKR